jgi:hypothetical protein
MPVLGETNIYRTWAAKQSAKGTPATVATRSFKQVAGTVVASIDTGSENFSDGTSFGDTTTWLNSITGTGSPGCEGTTDELAWLLWMFHGTETASPAGTNEVQSIPITGTPTGGNVSLVYDGRTTGTVPFNATAGQVDAVLEALPNLGAAQVSAAGGPWPNTAITVTFDGTATQKRPHPLIAQGVNGLTGGTSPTIGTVTKTTPGVNATHTTVAGGTAGFWLTWWQTVGQSTVQRLKMNDGRISSLTIEASTGTKALRVTPNLLFVDPAEVYATDPTAGMPTAPVMIYTEGAGSFTVDGTTFTGQTQFQITLNLDLSFVYGDNVTPFDLQRGNVGATVAATMLFDDTMLAKWNLWLYGTSSPTPGTKPSGRIPPVGSYSCNLVKKDSAANTIGTFNATFPGVQWDLPDSPGPNPDQGSAEVSLSGRLQKLPGITTLYTFSVGCQQAAFTG